MSRSLIPAALIALTILLGPSPLLADRGLIVALLRTDAIPGVQFDHVRSELWTEEGGTLITSAIHGADVDTDYEETIRVAQLQLPSGHDDGWYLLTTWLRFGSEFIAGRSTNVRSCCHSHGDGDHRPPTNLVTFVIEVGGPEESYPVALHHWYSTSRGDNFATNGWVGGPGDTRSPDYRWARLMGYAYSARAPGTIPLYHWYSSDLGDNLTTTDPIWSGRPGDVRAGYRFVGIMAYVLSDRVEDAIPLHSWYSPGRDDYFLSVDWLGGRGDTRSPDYEWVREDGYLLPGPLTVPFLRGDSDGNGKLDVTDGIRTLGYLFLGSPASLDCSDAADTDDSGTLNISDGVFLLQFMFSGGPPPPEPFEGCGEDAGGDDLDCESFRACAPAD